MATKRFSEFPAALAALLTDQIVGVKAGVNVRWTVQQLVDVINALTNPMEAAGDLIVGGEDGEVTRLPVGPNTYVLTVVDGQLAFAPVPGAGSGTGLINPMTTKNDLIVASDEGTAVRLPAGANGQFLRVEGGLLVWSDVAPGTGMGNPLTTLGDLLVSLADGVPGRLGAGTDGQVLAIVSGKPAWVTRESSIPAVIEDVTDRVLTLDDTSKYIRFLSVTNQLVTIPPQVTQDWLPNTEITIEQAGAGQVSFVPGAGVTLNKAAGFNARTRGQYSVVTLKRVGLNNWTLFGHLETP